MHGEVGKDLAINLDIGSFEAFNKAAVSDVLGSCSSADTLNPQATELSLTLLTVTILIRLRLTDCVLGVSVEFRAKAAETFSAFDNALPAIAAGWAICCSWRVSVV